MFATCEGTSFRYHKHLLSVLAMEGAGGRDCFPESRFTQAIVVIQEVTEETAWLFSFITNFGYLGREESAEGRGGGVQGARVLKPSG